MNEEEVFNIISDNLTTAKQGIFRQRKAFEEARRIFLQKQILSIVGVRRCGKSTVMKELVRLALQNTVESNVLYLNLEHPYFNQFKHDVYNLQLIYNIFRSKVVAGERCYVFLDEIQFFKDWQVFVKSLYEKDEAKIVLTGSNSRLLSSELATLLSGRTIPLMLYPYSMDEANTSFDEYLVDGGFPEIVSTPGSKKMLAEMYYKNILYQDVIPRFEIKNVLAMENLSFYLLSQAAKEISFNSLKSISHLDDKTAKDYISYLEDANLLYVISNYDFSLKKLIGNKKKVYLVDPIFALLSFKTSPDVGRLFENYVFMTLKRSGRNVYFHQNGGECDFILKEGLQIVEAIQVCYQFSDQNRKREIAGLLSALKKFNLSEGYLITKDQSENLEIEGQAIHILDEMQFRSKFGMDSENL